MKGNPAKIEKAIKDIIVAKTPTKLTEQHITNKIQGSQSIVPPFTVKETEYQNTPFIIFDYYKQQIAITRKNDIIESSQQARDA